VSSVFADRAAHTTLALLSVVLEVHLGCKARRSDEEASERGPAGWDGTIRPYTATTTRMIPWCVSWNFEPADNS